MKHGRFQPWSMSTLDARKKPALLYRLGSPMAGHMNPAAAKLLAFVLKIPNLVPSSLYDQKLKQSRLLKRGVGGVGMPCQKRTRQPSVLQSPTRNARLTDMLCACWGVKKECPTRWCLDMFPTLWKSKERGYLWRMRVCRLE